jgi:AAA+ superfamily predicted ATPase
MNAPTEMAREISAGRVPSWVDLNRQWLITAIASLRRRIEAHASSGSQARAGFQDCIEAADAIGFTPALVHCARAFGLSLFERELLLLVAGLELDHGLRAAVLAINSHISSRANFGIALELLREPHWDALSPDAPLRLWRMIEPEPGGHLTQAALHIDERLLGFIAGIATNDAKLASVGMLVTPGLNVLDDDLALIKRISRVLATECQRGPIVVLSGCHNDATARRDHALAVVAQLARSAFWIEARDLPTEPDALAQLAVHIDREAVLSGATPILSVKGGHEDPALALAARLRRAFIWLGVAHSDLGALPHAGRVLRFELPEPGAGRTHTLRARWQRLTPGGRGENPAVLAALDRAALQFHLGPAALDTIVERLQSTPPDARAGEVWSTVREAARGGLEAIAQRIVTCASFEDVVLPAGQSAMLRDIARQLRQRERVFREWGFGAKHRLGQGLVALFAGESGTGKTLAAEAIANEVELDLYRVDLATVVSKYIGETEKNLKRLFDAAEASGAVLLFDEADALFGKRSEVKDSHDRYANIEVAYLLQRVEAYRGLAVLTTNMKSALDRAFIRRIRFVVSFPHPDEVAREQIWRHQFPLAAPLGAIDFKSLAKLNIAGGNIRSIALNAAFKAADAGGVIDQSTLMAAAHEEFAKLERSLKPGGGLA